MKKKEGENDWILKNTEIKHIWEVKSTEKETKIYVIKFNKWKCYKNNINLKNLKKKNI